jgi:diaminohydroxyphosphoribosylaminopyrimidine deaminase / 5-amino-6-(5-phosphoribosylamino)uracil reductase
MWATLLEPRGCEGWSSTLRSCSIEYRIDDSDPVAVRQQSVCVFHARQLATMPETDQPWMERALKQAEQSVGLASPNPAVGCVLVRNDRLVGEGFHEYDRRDHAEIVALKQTGTLARGATAYVTLEPCTHHGRTGPCADALLAAGVTRVVVATADPNPVVQGKGIARLRAAGVEVTSGVGEDRARRLNDGFARFITTGLPFVTMKVAATLDGRIAPAERSASAPHWITGEQARAEVHRLRHAGDALIAGVGTILADDPLLTDRSHLPRRRPLLRIVLDSKLRTPLASQLVKTADQDVLIFFSDAGDTAQKDLLSRGVRLVQIAGDGFHVDLRKVLASLAEMQITSVLLEGGAEVHTTALNQGLVDKLMLFYAPRFLGDKAMPMLGSIEGVPAIDDFSLRRFGQDFAFEAYLRNPWLNLS